MGTGQSASVEGYRVIQCLPGSPLEEGGLQSYLDFITAANGIRLHNNGTFATIISKSVGCRVFLNVFNVLTRESREEVVIPREEWGGAGLLGGTVRFEDWNSENEFGVKVIGVIPGSVAEAAGLIAEEDYIIGTDGVTVRNVDHLAALSLKAATTLQLYVFNAKDRRVRTVTVNFGEGQRQLGIDAGQGVLHSVDFAVKKESVDSGKPKEDRKETATSDTEATVTILKEKVEAVSVVEEKPYSAQKESGEILQPPPILQKQDESASPMIPAPKDKTAFVPHVLKNPFQTS